MVKSQLMVRETRVKPADTEKITINLGFIDLGHIDLMVEDGFYSTRSDFIRTAVRNQLDRHAAVLQKAVDRNSLDLGFRYFSRERLEAARLEDKPLNIKVLGLASIASDVTPELAIASIASINVLGVLHASPEVRRALADRMQ